MKTVLVLVFLAFVAALSASAADRYSVLWAALAWAVVALYVAALLRLHAVINAPSADE